MDEFNSSAGDTGRDMCLDYRYGFYGFIEVFRHILMLWEPHIEFHGRDAGRGVIHQPVKIPRTTMLEGEIGRADESRPYNMPYEIQDASIPATTIACRTLHIATVQGI